MIKLGIVGCGNSATFHGNALQHLKDRFTISCCCDLDSVACMEWQKDHAPEAEVYTNLADMLEKEELNAVLLSSWPIAHCEQIFACIEAGIKYILCEKPLTVTAHQAYDIYKQATAKGVLILEGYANLHHPRIEMLEKIIADRGLGKADTVHAAFSLPDPENYDPHEDELSWRKRRTHAGGVPWEYSVFSIMACNRFIRDLPVGVYAHGDRGRYDTVTRMHGMIEYLHGGVGFLQSTKQNYIQDFNLTFPEAIINLPDHCWDSSPHHELSIEIRTERKNPTKEIIHTGPADRFVCQLAHFADCIEHNIKPRITLAQSVVGIFVLDGLVSSLVDQREIELDIPEEVIRDYEATLQSG